MSGRRLGVFVCACGGNISDHVDVEAVRTAAGALEDVAVAQGFQFACSDASQEAMTRAIRDQGLDGIVIASCSPRLHQGTFRAMARRAGLNQYLYTQVNVREQCSWAHRRDRAGATAKATALVAAGVARARRGEPLEAQRVETVPRVLVIGAGVAGLRAALALADLGLAVTVVERRATAGGHAAGWGRLFPDGRDGAALVAGLLARVAGSPDVALFTGAEVVEKSGSVGNFHVGVRVAGGETLSLRVGAIVVATGSVPHEPVLRELGTGLPGVVTLSEFREILAAGRGRLRHRGRDVRSVAYLYCVGDPGYCSRTCCAAAVHTALLAHQADPDLNQVHVHRDLRTYGAQELLFEEAGRSGSAFVRRGEEAPVVEPDGDGLVVRVKDELLGGEPIEVPVDLVVLVTGTVASENRRLGDLLKLPAGAGGFFQEVHPKLRPVETLVAGVFIAGAAQAPRNLAESVASGLAAAAKSAALLLQGHVELSPVVARVDPERCAWCGDCLAACPYAGAVVRTVHGGAEVAAVEPSLCKGCGGCVPVCSRDALALAGWSTAQVAAMIDALAAEVAP